VDEDQLRSAIRADESRCRSLVYRFTICPFYKGDAVYVREYLDPVEFRRDVLRVKLFYYDRGFRDAQVDTTVADAGRDRVRITMAVTEGPATRVDTVIVARASGLNSGRRRGRVLRLRKNDPLNLLRLDSSVVAVRQALGNRGFADAEVGAKVEVNEAARTAAVTITVDPKRRTTVDSIEIRGNNRVTSETIRNSLLVDEGKVFRVSDMLESQRALYESGLFRRADLTAAPPTDTTRAQVDSAKTVVVAVQEAPPRAARATVGFNTFEFFQVGGRYTNYSLLGGARRLDVQGALGNLGAEQLNKRFVFRNPQLEDSAAGRYFAPTYQASVDVTQRWFRSPRNTIAGGVFAQRRSSPLVFVDNSYGATATFTRELSPQAPLSANYRFEVSGVEAGDVYFCVNFGVCERETIDALNKRQRLSPASLVASLDRTNAAFSPSRGFRARGGVEHASGITFSDFRYNRITAEGAYFRPAFNGVLASRVRLGWVRPTESTNEATGARGLTDQTLLHPRKRFYAGGAQSVRGYGESQLGPRALTIPSSVLRGREVTVTGRDTVVTYSRCDLSTPIEACNPRAEGLDDDDFLPRPVGGSNLAEATVEYRFPLLRRFGISGAAFVDGAVVGASFTEIADGVAAVTPGFGVRYQSPVGPIRLDVGINPSVKEDLTVITESDGGATRGLVRLQGTERPDGSPLTPATRDFAAYQRSGGVGGVLGRLVLHLSIGEAF
jgi:outer membrane protein assembly complex protein YaeT